MSEARLASTHTKTAAREPGRWTCMWTWREVVGRRRRHRTVVYETPAKYKQQTQNTSDKKRAHTCINIATAHGYVCRTCKSTCFVARAVLSRGVRRDKWYLASRQMLRDKCFATQASRHFHATFARFASQVCNPQCCDFVTTLRLTTALLSGDEPPTAAPLRVRVTGGGVGRH